MKTTVAPHPNLVPWIKKIRLTEDDLEMDIVFITVDGRLCGVVREALAGENGLVEEAIQQNNEYLVDDRGEPQFVRHEGRVEFWVPRELA